MNKQRPYRNRAAALLLVLWAIAILSFAVLWVADLVNLELAARSADSRGMAARQIALSGVAIGLHPQVTREDTELLNREVRPGETMRVRIRGEGARFNINRLLAQQDRMMLKNLFVLWGLDGDAADVLIDRLTDWVDDDIGRQLNGAERSEYEAAGIVGAPADRPFRSVDEMGRVLGMEELAAVKPDWRDAFTIFGDGKIDVNEAGADVLQAATGLTPEMTADVIRARLGPDGEEGTEDDLRFESIDQLNGWLTASSYPADQAAARLATESTVKRIDSRGMVGDCERLISVVAESGDGSQGSSYLLWEEK
ncbi:MAG: general secretion pathway protein GspK [Chthoniobacterales bacterium]|nr:general secretion pathway protein GspK [Chthoniobacterales bacterium]